jgi:signal peptidase II
MTRRRGHLLFWLGVIGGLAADLVSKHCVFQFLSRHDGTYDVWPGVFMLSRHTNTGGPFSILGGHSSMLVAVTFLALIVMGYLYLSGVRQGKTPALVGLSLITAGALGNLADRLHGGEVRDFLNFYIIHYPVFNVADILIVAGAIVYGIEVLRGEPKTPKTEASRGSASHG